MWLLVMAATISSLSAFCSRSLSLFSQYCQPATCRSLRVGSSRYAHRFVDLLRRQLAVDLLHGLSCALHGGQGLAVDVGRLDGIYLLLERADLRVGLLQAMFVDLLTPEGCLGRYRDIWLASAGAVLEGRLSIDTVPFLFELTFLRASASCSSICVSRCRFRFCSISSCDLKPRIAFFGVSFRFWAAPPPNQPQTPDMLIIRRLRGVFSLMSSRRLSGSVSFIGWRWSSCDEVADDRPADGSPLQPRCRALAGSRDRVKGFVEVDRGSLVLRS